MERGQASLEYVAVVALVTAALGVVAAVAGAEAIPAAVAAQVHRAFCIVEGGDCLSDEGPRPCVVRARAGGRQNRVSLVVARAADGREILTEERSDDTFAVTVTDTGEATAGRKIASGVIGRLGARLSAGRRWVVADRAAAARLVARIEAEDRAPVGEALSETVDFLQGEGEEERFARFGSRGEADAVLRGLRIDAAAGFVAGARIDGRSGRRTLELRSDGEAAAALAAPLAKLTGAGHREITLEAVVDPGRGPVELTVKLAAGARGAATVAGVGARGGHRVEADARLDLAEPRARALAGALLRDPTPANAAALGAHLRDRARIDVRRYATTHDEERDRRLLVGETVETLDTARLVDAFGREPGGAWTRRLDCTGVR